MTSYTFTHVWFPSCKTPVQNKTVALAIKQSRRLLTPGARKLSRLSACLFCSRVEITLLATGKVRVVKMRAGNMHILVRVTCAFVGKLRVKLRIVFSYSENNYCC